MNKDKERNLYKESKRNQYRGIFDTPLRPRARPRLGTQARYKESGAAADELSACPFCTDMPARSARMKSRCFKFVDSIC